MGGCSRSGSGSYQEVPRIFRSRVGGESGSSMEDGWRESWEVETGISMGSEWRDEEDEGIMEGNIEDGGVGSMSMASSAGMIEGGKPPTFEEEGADC